MTINIDADQSTLSTRVIRDYTSFGGINTATVQRLFSIFIINSADNKIVSNSTLDPSGQRGLAEYFFTVAPKSFEMSEPFASNIVATQNGGKFVDSQGSIFKNIRLQGTTGLRPNKTAPKSVPLLGISTDTLTALRTGLTRAAFGEPTLPTNEITGHDDIIFLRNLFRFYSDQKGKDNLQLYMVFRNVRDDDYWIVEPEDFRLVRDSSSPLTYEYQIQLKALGKYTASFNPSITDPMKRLRDLRRASARLQGYSQALTTAFLQVSTQITRISAAGWSGVRTLLGPLAAVIQGAQALANAGRQTKAGLFQAIEYCRSLLTDGIASLSTTFRGSQNTTIRTLRRTLVLLNKLKCENIIRDTVASNNADITTRNNAIYRGRPSTELSSNNVAQGTVYAGENIRSLSRRLTGSSDNWKTIAQINNLRPPYISDNPNAGEGVLRTGDTILYPSTSRNDLDGSGIGKSDPIISAENENRSQNLEGPVIEAFGRDLRLTTTVSGQDIDLTDVTINQQGDLSTIAGIPNVDQSIRIKFSTEQGELPKHPYFGTLYPIGTKALPTSFNSFRINALATFSSDSRIKDVQDLRFNTFEDALVMSAKVLLSDSKNFLTTDFALRRF